jgi:hypothetical protein
VSHSLILIFLCGDDNLFIKTFAYRMTCYRQTLTIHNKNNKKDRKVIPVTGRGGP